MSDISSTYIALAIVILLSALVGLLVAPLSEEGALALAIGIGTFVGVLAPRTK